jgi:hypothetical protein
MAGILSIDDFLASKRQELTFYRSASRSAVANCWTGLDTVAGQPWVATAPAGSTATGVVPTDLTAGFNTIIDFDSGGIGYIAKVEYAETVSGRLQLADRLWVAGPYASGTVTLASQASYASRIPTPGGTADYTSTELWIECTVAGTISVTVTYTNDAGVTGKSTGSNSFGGMSVGQRKQLPLAQGDKGLQKIESVVTTGTGSYAVMVLRPLWTNRIAFQSDGSIDDLLKTGLPQVFQDSALEFAFQPDSTNTGALDARVLVASKA